MSHVNDNQCGTSAEQDFNNQVDRWSILWNSVSYLPEPFFSFPSGLMVQWWSLCMGSVTWTSTNWSWPGYSYFCVSSLSAGVFCLPFSIRVLNIYIVLFNFLLNVIICVITELVLMLVLPFQIVFYSQVCFVILLLFLKATLDTVSSHRTFYLGQYLDFVKCLF